MSSLAHDFASALRLMWRPHRLAETALRCRHRSVWLLGWVAAALEFALVLAAAFAGLDEPYLDLRTYLLGTITGVFFGAFPIGLVVLLPVLVAMAVLSRLGRPDTLQRRLWNIGMLAPLIVLLPCVLWAPFAVLATVADPAFGLISGKPAWITAPWLGIAGSCLWLPLFAIGYAWFTTRAAQRATAMLAPGTRLCSTCLYDLSGHEAERCPECGERI